MIFEEDVDYFGKHIYVNIGSKQVIAVYLGYYDQEQSWIAVVVKHPYDENDISFRFYDLAMVSLKIDEDEYEITGKRRNESEMFDLSITNHEKEEVSQNKKLCKVSK